MARLLTLRGPNNEEFTLKVNDEINIQIEKDYILDTLAANLNEIVGTGINLQVRDVTLNCVIANMESSDYPNSDIYTNHNHGYAIEIEKAINNWGTTITTDGIDNTKVIWERGGVTQEKDGSLTSLSLSLLPSDNSMGEDVYEMEITFTEVDAVVE